MTQRILAVVASAALVISCAPPSARNMPPIIGAARSGDTGRIEQLLADGADPNVRAGVNDWTPLLHAIHKNQEESVRMLLAHRADVNARGGGGITPLIMAAGYG
jgi:ankyrin repeat protein